jgi:putative hydrolase
MSVPFGFGAPDGGGGFDMNSLGAALQQLGQFLQQGGNADEGAVRWTMVADVARQTLAQRGQATNVDGDWIVETMRLADLWLDAATRFPATGPTPLAWSRQDWLDNTLTSWKPIVEPIAQHMQSATSALPGTDVANVEDIGAMLPEQMRQMFPGGQVPAELGAMLGPMLGMVQQLGSVAFSMQLGQALASLAGEVLSSGDIGIPLGEGHAPSFVTINIADFGKDLSVPLSDVQLYIALREGAHQRLFAHVPWLRPRVIGALEEYARGLKVDGQRLQEAMGEIDISNPEALQSMMASGLLQPEDTPEQRAALARLETLLALIEGWVDDVVDTAIGDRLASANALRETMRRRRAVGGPGERAFGTLVGMQMRPTSLKEAATIFQGVRSMQNADARDGLWEHPDLLPDAADLAEPMDFLGRLTDSE